MAHRVMLRMVLTIVLVCLCLGSYGLGSKETLVYEVKMKSSFGDMGTRKMTMKGPYFLWDANSPGVPSKVLKNKDGTFLVSEARKIAGKYPPGSSRESPMVFLPGPIGDVKAFLKEQKAVAAGSAKVLKKQCRVYTYTEKVTKWRCKLWVDSKTGTPVQLAMTSGQAENNVTATYTSYKRNVKVDDSVFNIPKGMRITDMPKSAAPSAASAEGNKAKSQPGK